MVIFIRTLATVGLSLTCIAPVGAADSTRRAIASSEAIHELLAERMAHNGVGLVVGIVEPSGHRVITFGKSGAKGGRPLDGDTVFQIGSATKVFTGLLLADMVQRGEVKFDDPAARYLPPGLRMPMHDASGNEPPITLLHLATHFSGLPSMPNNFVLTAKPNPIEGYKTDDLFAFLSSYVLPRAPGTKSEYSNLGVSLLGSLLARRAGVDYETLLKQRVLRPLQLTSTSITLDRSQKARLAPGHNRYLQPVDTWEMRAMPASGSLRSTANDLLKLLAAYLHPENGPLKDALALSLSTRFPPASPGALGWTCRKIETEDVCYKDGGKAGYRSAIAIAPGSGNGIVVLANARTDDTPQALALHLIAGAKLNPATAAPAPRKNVKLPRAVLDRYAGRYQMEPGVVMTVIRNRGRLLVEVEDSGPLEFLPEGDADFYLSSGNDALSFTLDGAGEVTGLVHFPDGRDADARRAGTRIRAKAESE